MNETYYINDNEYKIHIRWDNEIGIIFDILMRNAISSLQDIHNNFINDKNEFISRINTYVNHLNEEGANISDKNTAIGLGILLHRLIHQALRNALVHLFGG